MEVNRTMIGRGIVALGAVLLAPWLLWAALAVGGWVLIFVVPAVILYWVLTFEFYSRRSDGIARFTQTKDLLFRNREKRQEHTYVKDVSSASHKRASKPNQTARSFHHKHRHPLGQGVTFEPQ